MAERNRLVSTPFGQLRLYWALATALWALVILGLSIMPGSDLPDVEIWEFDKFAHLGVYALLALLGCLSAQYPGEHGRYRIAGTAFLRASLYGIVIEFIQNGMIRDREFDILDIVANIIGSFTGVTIYWFMMNRKSMNQTSQ